MRMRCPVVPPTTPTVLFLVVHCLKLKGMNIPKRVCRGPSPPPRGFTLIEVLLVTVLFSVVGILLYKSLSNGLRLWNESQETVVEEDIVIFLDKFSEDLRGALRYSLIPFEGKENALSFATLVRTSADERGSRVAEGVIEQIGAVEYHFNFEDKKLYRRQANYSQAVHDKFGSGIPVLASVDSVKFTYMFWDGKVFSRQKAADEDVPAYVEAEVVYQEKNNQKIFKRLLEVPVGL